MILQGSLSFGKMLALGTCVTLVLCSSCAELSNGPVNLRSSPFYSEQSKRMIIFRCFS